MNLSLLSASEQIPNFVSNVALAFHKEMLFRQHEAWRSITLADHFYMVCPLVHALLVHSSFPGLRDFNKAQFMGATARKGSLVTNICICASAAAYLTRSGFNDRRVVMAIPYAVII